MITNLHTVQRLILLLVVISPVFLQPVDSRAQSVGSECHDLLREALQRRNAPPDSGYTLYRIMHVMSYSLSGDTTTVDAVSIEAPGLYIVRSDSSEVWQDSLSMAIVDHRQQQVQLIDLSSRSGVLAARRWYQEAFFDSLASDLREVSCSNIGEVKRISGVVIAEKQLFYKIQSLSVDVRSDGEIIRYVTQNLEGSPTQKTEFIVTEIDRRYKGVDPGKSVQENFVDTTGRRIQGTYSQYRLSKR